MVEAEINAALNEQHNTINFLLQRTVTLSVDLAKAKTTIGEQHEALAKAQAALEELTAKSNEISSLKKLIVNMTHHDGAVEEFRPIWEPLVKEELGERAHAGQE